MAEEWLRIRGGKPLQGEIKTQGAKNAALPLMAATLLCDGETHLSHVPALSDVWAASRILNRLGVTCLPDGDGVTIRNDGLTGTAIPDADMRRMRSSIMFLGPILGRMHACELTLPGGCELGPRPIDYHLEAMRRMGAVITEEHGAIICRAERLQGTHIALPFPSVGVTENVIMAAVLAEGETVLTNAAREPEIADLAQYLNQCGAKIFGAGESTIRIEGVSQLHGTVYTVMPDRIVAMTWLCAGAVTGGTVCVKDVVPADLDAALNALQTAGCRIASTADRIYLDAGRRLHAVRYLRTMPYPGFPTDAQALMMAVLSRAAGTSVFEETVFDSRYKHVGELLRMGADIRVSGRIAVVNGVAELHGADVEAMDLRGGAALAIAAVAAKGESRLTGLTHLDRGYAGMAECLRVLGGDVVRMGSCA